SRRFSDAPFFHSWESSSPSQPPHAFYPFGCCSFLVSKKNDLWPTPSRRSLTDNSHQRLLQHVHACQTGPERCGNARLTPIRPRQLPADRPGGVGVVAEPAATVPDTPARTRSLRRTPSGVEAVHRFP